MSGRMGGNILEEFSRGYQYPIQKLYYEDVEYPNVVTRIEQYDKRGVLRAKTVFKLVSSLDVAKKTYVAGSEGNIAEINFYEYDHFGSLIA